MTKRRVFVLGSINLDIQLAVAALPLPGETVRSLSTRRGLGGKGANQAIAASRAGADALLIGAVGNSTEVIEQIQNIAPHLDVSGVARVPDCETGSAYIFVAQDGENQIVIVEGANALIADPDMSAVAAGDICLAQLEIPLPIIARFFEAARQVGARTVLNAAPALNEALILLDHADFLIVNETELAQFSVNASGGDRYAEEIISIASDLRKRDDQTIIVTLGAYGVVVVGEQAFHVPARAVRPIDTTGAGDCFCGVFCAELANGRDITSAVRTANLAASLQVERAGAAEAMPWRAQIDAIA